MNSILFLQLTFESNFIVDMVRLMIETMETLPGALQDQELTKLIVVDKKR